jgi:hypothetical protein
VFSLDERRDLITLRVHPTGESRDGDAVLLMVYGYQELKGLDEVLVTKLTKSLTLSGLKSERLDRLAAEHFRNQWLVKHGAAKGGKYFLTLTGRNRAEAMVKELHDRVA